MIRYPRFLLLSILAALSLSVASLLAFGLLGPAAAGPSTSTVTVQGTTDIRDAGLLEDLIIPGFEAAYPEYTLKYIAVGSGQAIANAKAGQGDALVTHAPTDEKALLDDGYSLEPRGRAIFYSDYVIVGPSADPAGVIAGGAAHDAALAYERVARAGAEGNANFVSRGDDSGTNTQEKLIWALTEVELNSNGEPGPAGTTEISPWYQKAGLGQAESVQLTQQCPFAGANCYEMTDRGTFNRLESNGSVTTLKVVSDRNDAAAPGGVNLLINPFTVYVVNPAKVPGVNVEGARAFSDYLTSRAFQADLAGFPTSMSPAFVADARPEIELSSAPLPARVDAGAWLRVAGTIANRLPGAPAPAGATVLLQHAAPVGPGEVPSYTTIARTSTDSSGTFGFAKRASQGGRLRVLFPSTTSYPSLTVNPLIAVAGLTETALDLGEIEVSIAGKPGAR